MPGSHARGESPAHAAAGLEPEGAPGLAGVQERDRRALGPEQGAGAVDDEREDLLEVEGRRDRAAELGERLRLVAPRGAVGEQARVADRDGGMVGEAEQDVLVAIGEDPVIPVRHRQESLDPLLDLDRDRHVRAHAFLARDRRERRGDPGILEVAVRPERMAVGEDVTGGALPRRDAHRAVAFVLRARPVAELDAVGARITQRDERHVALAHPAGALGDSLQHRRQIERRVDGAYHRRQ